MTTYDPQSLNISDQTQSAVFMQCTPSNKGPNLLSYANVIFVTSYKIQAKGNDINIRLVHMNN